MLKPNSGSRYVVLRVGLHPKIHQRMLKRTDGVDVEVVDMWSPPQDSSENAETAADSIVSDFSNAVSTPRFIREC